MTTATKQQVSDIVQTARKIAAESNRPMSPFQIRQKYQLNFPFTIKRVVDSPLTSACCADEAAILKTGAIITLIGHGESDSYEYEAKCPHGYRHSLLKDSERFVLV
jgi:hypothetical protein